MAQRTNVSKVKSTVAPSTDFLDGLTGDGLETMTDAAVSTAYLGIVQPGSSATAEGAEPGTFRNSATGENYGNTVRVVPIAFDTFKAVHDIITNEENGIIVSQLSLESYAEKLENLMLDDLRLQRMAENGIETCKRFSVSKVVDKWQSIFKELVPEL